MFKDLTLDELEDLFDLKASGHVADVGGGDPSCDPSTCCSCYGGTY
jgi:hypothetical protein